MRDSLTMRSQFLATLGMVATLMCVGSPRPSFAAAAVAPPADGQAAVCERMFDWLGDGPIIFGHAASWIRRSSYPYLMRLAEFAHDCPTYAIAITGHTDGTGDAAFNQALSEQRAQAIADFLVYLGTASDRLIVAGMGESKPAASNSTVHGREQNRRIELRLVPMAQLAN